LILSLSAEVESEKQLNFYLNSGILVISFIIILYLMKKNNANKRDEENYDWSKYTILSESKYKNKKTDKKDKIKPRIKEYSKGTGFVNDQHKFSTEKEEKKYLNIEEKDNLNDMLNYVASQTESHPIESLYSNVKNKSYNFFVNESIDESIVKLLTSEDADKNKKILELYAQLLNSEKNVLSDRTYLALVEFFIKNGQLNYASYFLCQLDKLKINIPRQVLDLFLDSSIAQKIFDRPEDKKKEAKEKNANKFDQYDLGNYPDYAFYLHKRNNFKKRDDIEKIFSKLKVEAEPFFPKKKESDVKQKLSDIDISKVKEFYPKNYKVVSKETHENK